MKKILTTLLVLTVCMMQVFALSTVLSLKAGPSWTTTNLMPDGVIDEKGAMYLDVPVYVDGTMFFGEGDRYGLSFGMEAISFPAMATVKGEKQPVEWTLFSYLSSLHIGMAFKCTENENGELLLSVGASVDYDNKGVADKYDKMAVSIGLIGDLTYNWRVSNSIALSVGAKFGSPFAVWQKIDSKVPEIKSIDSWLMMPGTSFVMPFVGCSVYI